MQSARAVSTKVWNLMGILGILSLLFGCGSKDRTIGHEFTVANGVVHYRDAPIEGADPGSFQPRRSPRERRPSVLLREPLSNQSGLLHHETSRTHVIEGADAASFQLLRLGYARDARRVYFEGALIDVEDVDTFELLEYGFARDRVRGYYMEEPVPGSDGSTFVVLDNHYAKYETHLFHCDLESGVDGSPPLRVTVQLPEADLASFTPLESGYAKDAGQAYYKGRVITRDADSFAALHFDYAKSSSQVFYLGDVVEGADAATFVVARETSIEVSMPRMSAQPTCRASARRAEPSQRRSPSTDVGRGPMSTADGLHGDCLPARRFHRAESPNRRNLTVPFATMIKPPRRHQVVVISPGCAGSSSTLSYIAMPE